MTVDTGALLDRILITRPVTTPDDVRALGPVFAHLQEAKTVADAESAPPPGGSCDENRVR